MRDNRYRLKDDEIEILEQYRGAKDAAEEMQVDFDDVKHGWLKSDHASLFFKNRDFEMPEFDVNSIDFAGIAKRLNRTMGKPVQFLPERSLPALFDRVVTSDAHIGMEVNPDGVALYPAEWNREELMKRAASLIDHVRNTQKSSTIIWDDLGDLMDGWNAQTTRKHHELHQNMSNQAAFDAGLEFKVFVATELHKTYKRVIIHDVCEDNHAGAFGYVVNAAFKAVIDAMGLSGVEVHTFRRFMTHYDIEGYTFIITHGKDSENLKFGFKPFVDSSQKEKIDNYLDEYHLWRPGAKIEFSKGDSHLMVLDYTSSTRFNYFSYPTFAPSSTWVQHNFKNTKSGFVSFNYFKDYHSVHPHFFPDRIKDKYRH